MEAKVKNTFSDVLQKFLKNNHQICSVFDIGANDGKWTARYENLIPSATFFLFEANPKRKRPTRIDKKHKWISAVLSSPEINEVTFYERMGTGDSYYKERTTFYDSCNLLKIDTVTLDELVIAKRIPMPQIIKLDTQGSEIDILKGSKKILEFVELIQIEVPILAYNEGAPSFNDYVQFIVDSGFVPIGVDEIHLNDNILMQLDIVFIKKHIKEKYYGSKNFWKGIT